MWLDVILVDPSLACLGFECPPSIDQVNNEIGFDYVNLDSA